MFSSVLLHQNQSADMCMHIFSPETCPDDSYHSSKSHHQRSGPIIEHCQRVAFAPNDLHWPEGAFEFSTSTEWLTLYITVPRLNDTQWLLESCIPVTISASLLTCAGPELLQQASLGNMAEVPRQPESLADGYYLFPQQFQDAVKVVKNSPWKLDQSAKQRLWWWELRCVTSTWMTTKSIIKSDARSCASWVWTDSEMNCIQLNISVHYAAVVLFQFMLFTEVNWSESSSSSVTIEATAWCEVQDFNWLKRQARHGKTCVNQVCAWLQILFWRRTFMEDYAQKSRHANDSIPQVCCKEHEHFLSLFVRCDVSWVALVP